MPEQKRPPQPGGTTAKGLEEENRPSEVPERNFTGTFWASERPSGLTFRHGRRRTASGAKTLQRRSWNRRESPSGLRGFPGGLEEAVKLSKLHRW